MLGPPSSREESDEVDEATVVTPTGAIETNRVPCRAPNHSQPEPLVVS